MIVFPNAKINLGLTIVSKRPDLFHNLETCFVSFGWKDALEIVESQHFEFTSSGIPISGNPETNLCVRAYQMLKTDFDLPNIKLHLHKNIPIGAGLGGGSADAAFTLTLLNQKFNLNLSNQILENYARKLGSDCAFFIENAPKFATEKGDVFEDIDVNLKNKYLVVVYPNLHVSTAEAYAGVQPRNASANLFESLQKPIETWKNSIENDFEISVFRKYPQLMELKNYFYSKGAIYASMSGSGSAIFGIFEQETILNFEPSFNTWNGFL